MVSVSLRDSTTLKKSALLPIPAACRTTAAAINHHHHQLTSTSCPFRSLLIKDTMFTPAVGSGCSPTCCRNRQQGWFFQCCAVSQTDWYHYPGRRTKTWFLHERFPCSSLWGRFTHSLRYLYPYHRQMPRALPTNGSVVFSHGQLFSFFLLILLLLPNSAVGFFNSRPFPPADRPTDRPSDRCLSIRLSERFKDTSMLIGRKDFGVFQYLSKSPIWD